MAPRAHHLSLVFLFSVLVLSLPGVVFPATFTFVNQCGYTVWPGLLSSAGSPQLSTTGFALNSGDSIPVSAPASWSGRMWGRTLCSQDSASGRFTCLTGDCGSGTPECGGPRRRLQSAYAGDATGRDRRRELHDDRVRRRPQRLVPVGAEGGERVSSSSGGEGAWRAGARARRSGRLSIVAAASMGRRILASRARTLSCSRARARGLTAMLTMTAPAHLPVLPRITSSPSALLLQPVMAISLIGPGKQIFSPKRFLSSPSGLEFGDPLKRLGDCYIYSREEAEFCRNAKEDAFVDEEKLILAFDDEKYVGKASELLEIWP
ncbi:Thaumatin-like protein [Sesamum angolense]|uniref:Thaumatin-like protein n=1 Tax=Sesamum angolense TaxID=2727404 RepID=A0AAE2BQA9_9LAMI|nr:Thaumatin-like protein [Sesamum angolense]